MNTCTHEKKSFLLICLIC